MNENTKQKIVILAGPNGAGKTTFAREYLIHEADCPTFINADLIADGLSPFAPDRVAIRAGRIMLQLMAEAVRKRDNFAFETTLSARNYARSIPKWRALGYVVLLHFLSLPSADVAVARVSERVRQGGHHVPENVVRRRFESGLKNFESVYKKIVDKWIHYDCACVEPRIIELGDNR